MTSMPADGNDRDLRPYRPRRRPVQEFVDVRGLRYHVNRWAGEGGEPVVMLHGWMDCGATYQFLVDELPDSWRIMAPDWRGFGETARCEGGYYFPDYLADLDRLLDICFGDEPVTVIGHSMGGNVAGLYAGVRPERVRKLVSIEGFGMGRTAPDQAPERYANWLDSLRERPQVRPFGDFEALAEHLMRKNPRTSPDRAAYVARCWGRLDRDGQVRLRGDPAHKRPNPVLYRLDEAMACWERVAAPTLWVAGADSPVLSRVAADVDLDQRTGCFADLAYVTVNGAGHAVHFDQPAVLAGHVTRFVEGDRGGRDG